MNTLSFDRNFESLPGRCESVSPLVRRVLCANPSAFTFKGTNSYLVGEGSVAVIDPGPDDEAHLQALLAAIGAAAVSHILITHTHMDHSPLAARLKAITGAPVLAAPLTACGEESEVRLDASIDQSFSADVTLTGGDVIEGRGFTLECVFTPGHMSNHMAFALREEQALFSGDHVMAWATSVVAPPDGHMGDYMASLRKLLRRDDAVYYPGHGPARVDPLPLVRGILAHRGMREESIFRRLQQGDRRIADVVAASYSDVDPRLHPAAALSTRAHLEHLIEQGRVRLAEPGVYEPVK